MIRKLSNITARTVFFLASLFAGSEAFAITTPTSTTAFLYPLYKIVVLDIGSGPTMFAVGFIGVCVAGYFLYHHQMGRFAGSLVATSLIAGAAGIVPTLGATF
jgi:hypothetical protein